MAEIKKLKSERTQLRRLFTRAGNDLEQKLNADQPTGEEISAGFKIFEDKTERLFGLDERIREVWYSGEYEEEDIIAEYELMEEYREKWLTLKTRYENFLHTLNDNGANSVASAGSSKSRSKRNLRLPKLELKQFDGDVRNSIAFWGQFKKIHEDDEIEEEDKFQYLCQATVPGTSARELVESFPPSASNYQKAIEQLKSRFARDELLIEIYVRELLQLVLQKSSMLNDISLRSLFDKLETQLRALESLRVTSDKYAAMLYPLVESALPDDILKAWERSRMSQACKKDDQSNYLETLLRFLRQEVESEERLLLARTNFHGGCVGSSQSNKEKVPTAAVIFSSEKERSDRACIWCEKGNHMSQECFKPRGLTTEKKQQILKKKGACFHCLQMGHNSKRCKAVIKCLICCKGHHTIMCRSLTDAISVDNTKKGPVEKGNEPDSTENLLSHQKGQTLLQTLVVKVSVNKVDKLARVLLDTGSQRSYITKDSVHKLGLKKIGEETLTHNLFGGVETGQEVHGIYDVTLRSLDEKFECTIPMLDQEKICGFVPRLETQQYYPMLRDHNITLSDVGYNVPEVKILLGADIIGQLLTGCRVVLDDTMVALETKLGWTLMGQRRILSNCNAVSNLFCMAAFDIAELWRLEALGISDPADVKTKEILEAETLEFFEKTVRVDQEGRYEVCLPWKEGHPQLRDSYDLAEKRLFSVSKRLETIAKLEENEEFKKPILLPSSYAVVTRLIWDEHHRSQHAGLLTLLARLRDRYWILWVRKAAKRVIARCVKCKRYKASPAATDFSLLPKDRVGSTAAFEVSGVDYAGPLYLKSGEKAWVVLFTCAVYHAIHLELVQSLTTDAFILALRRFIARRGRISVLYSDNGTNFIGCNNALKMLDWDEIITHSAVKRITWKFIPPTAAWWGGWWERLVRTVKELLRRILGRASIYYEELYTVLCDCEATINSRPLTYIEDSSAELKPLTPATFLQGIPTNETPDLDFVDKIDYVKRCRYLQKLREDLRQRFRSEYLALLVHHGRRKSSSIKVGDVVLIGADSTKRINWPLGVVLEVYPGKDKVARVAKLKTSEGELIRPFQRLYPLEVHTTPKDWKQPETEKIASPNMKSSHEELKTSRVGRRIKVPSRLDL